MNLHNYNKLNQSPQSCCNGGCLQYNLNLKYHPKLLINKNTKFKILIKDYKYLDKTLWKKKENPLDLKMNFYSIATKMILNKTILNIIIMIRIFKI